MNKPYKLPEAQRKELHRRIQSIYGIESIAVATYQEAAGRILDELDARGFNTDDPMQTVGLRDKIKDIILETVLGNTNYCVSTASELDEEYPPCHPLEN